VSSQPLTWIGTHDGTDTALTFNIHFKGRTSTELARLDAATTSLKF